MNEAAKEGFKMSIGENNRREMSGKYQILQKKVQELVAEVAVIARLPLNPTLADGTQFKDIKERIDFLEKLRVAEADSDELHDIDRRIAGLKAAYSDLIQSRNSSGFSDDDDDTETICFDCTHNQVLLRGSASPARKGGELSGPKHRKKAAAVKEVAIVEGNHMGRYCGAFGSGVIVGAVCMLFKLYYSDYIFLEEAFLLPPT